MQIKPRIETQSETKLIGQHLTMSLSDNKTAELWRSFMPRRKEITNAVDANLFSLQLYPAHYFQNFNPNTEFEKWAAVAVQDFDHIPKGMERLTIPAGLYAVFHYKGRSNDPSIFNYIFTDWLPRSDYKLDHRPHFEVLGEKYKNNDENSEEDIWIPVRR